MSLTCHAPSVVNSAQSVVHDGKDRIMPITTDEEELARPPLCSPTLTRRAFGALAAVTVLATQASGSARAGDLSTLEENKALVRRLFEEAVNRGNAAVIGELYAAAFVKRGRPSGQMPGPVGMPVPFQEFRSAFPDVTVTVDAVVAEEDLVSTRATWWGTHPPAGSHVVGRTMHFFHIANGQIVEQWSTGWEWLVQRGYRPEPRPSNPLAVPSR